MKTLRTITAIITLALVLPFQASAKPAILKKFKTAYPTAKVSALSCTMCHNADNALNTFGEDVAKNITANAGSPKWADLETIDSDGDGYTNLEEWVAGNNPGDRNDKPANH